MLSAWDGAELILSRRTLQVLLLTVGWAAYHGLEAVHLLHERLSLFNTTAILANEDAVALQARLAFHYAHEVYQVLEGPSVRQVEASDSYVQALAAVGDALSPDNENVRRGYLVAAINDIRQILLGLRTDAHD